MKNTKIIEISNEFMELAKEKGFEFVKRGRQKCTINKEEENEILRIFGFNENDNVEIQDFFEFYQYFGNDRQRYLKLKSAKDEMRVSWKELAQLKWEDIDFAKNTINIEEKVRKVKDNIR